MKGGMVENSTDKERMTLWLDRSIKDELKRQAKNSGVSVSAFVSMLVSMRKTALETALEMAENGLNMSDQ